MTHKAICVIWFSYKNDHIFCVFIALDTPVSKHSCKRKTLHLLFTRWLVFPFIWFLFPIPPQPSLYLQLKYFWVPRASTFLHSQLCNPWQSQLPHPPSDSLNAQNAHRGKLSKLSGQCSAVNWLPNQTSKQTLSPDSAENNHKWCNLKRVEIYTTPFSFCIVYESKSEVCHTQRSD